MRFLLSLLLLLSSYAFATQTAHTLFEQKLKIAIPSELKLLSPQTINKRFGNQKQPPNTAFSNLAQTVSFTFTQYETPAEEKNMRKIHKSLSNMLRAANPKARWKKDKVYSRYGTKVAVYEYEIKGKSKFQYNLTLALPVNGQLTFITFITTDKKYKNKWLTAARESIDSIEILF